MIRFFSFPQHPGVSVVERQQAWYFYTSTSCCAARLPLLDEEVAGACYFPQDVSNYS